MKIKKKNKCLFARVVFSAALLFVNKGALTDPFKIWIKYIQIKDEWMQIYNTFDRAYDKNILSCLFS